MNLDFIRRAEKVTSFNLTTKDFETLDHKQEIQHLFNKHFFPEFNLEKTLDQIDLNTINLRIADLKKEQGGMMLAKLHSYNLKGVGPGEATLFFLCNKVRLGGGSSAGVDIIDGTTKYEVKAALISQSRVASNFKLGGTVPLSDIIIKLNDLREQVKAGDGNKTEIRGSVMAVMESKAPDQYRQIQEMFAERAYEEYFKGHDVIFINNNPGHMLNLLNKLKRKILC